VLGRLPLVPGPFVVAVMPASPGTRAPWHKARRVDLGDRLVRDFAFSTRATGSPHSPGCRRRAAPWLRLRAVCTHRTTTRVVRQRHANRPTERSAATAYGVLAIPGVRVLQNVQSAAASFVS
jgi:hypothetical protein